MQFENETENIKRQETHKWLTKKDFDELDNIIFGGNGNQY